MTRFWNKFKGVHSKSKDWKTKKFFKNSLISHIQPLLEKQCFESNITTAYDKFMVRVRNGLSTSVKLVEAAMLCIHVSTYYPIYRTIIYHCAKYKGKSAITLSYNN
jgi:hypothetical protein